ncbi:Centrosomal protein of 78 kDa [Schistosoma japonicum]|nr:Centrosomal protein of 78 kDa [Schistosoma japonicum]
MRNFQAMQRHNAAWQESLRYRYPELDRLGGLKRITLNDNPKIGDEGSILLADALIDDLWMLFSLMIVNSPIMDWLARDLLRAVTERALINSEGKQTEFSWLKTGSQTPSQLCSGVTTYPWPGLTGITNISNIHQSNQSKSIKSINNSCQIKSISNNSLDYGKLTNFNNLNNVHRSYKCNNLTDRPPFILS